MSKKRRTLILVLCASLVVAISIAGYILAFRRTVSIPSIEASLKQHIQPGASVAEVIAYLDKERIQQFGYGEGPEPLFAPNETVSTAPFRRSVVAKIPNVRWGVFNSWNLYLLFFFDADGKLTEYKIRVIGTGL